MTSTGFEFLETIEFSGNLQEDGNEDKLVPKVAALTDCAIVYVSAIGSSAAKRLLAANITPLRAESESDRIGDVLGILVEMLQGSPPPWLRKVLGRGASKSEDRFDRFAQGIEEPQEEEVLI